MVRPKGGAARRRTAAACPVSRRGREPAKRQVAWQGDAPRWMLIRPNWSTADGGHQPAGALLTHVEGSLSSPLFTHGFCRGAIFPSMVGPPRLEPSPLGRTTATAVKRVTGKTISASGSSIPPLTSVSWELSAPSTCGRSTQSGMTWSSSKGPFPKSTRPVSEAPSHSCSAGSG